MIAISKLHLTEVGDHSLTPMHFQIVKQSFICIEFYYIFMSERIGKVDPFSHVSTENWNDSPRPKLGLHFITSIKTSCQPNYLNANGTPFTKMFAANLTNMRTVNSHELSFTIEFSYIS